jgi:hypothetical protein
LITHHDYACSNLGHQTLWAEAGASSLLQLKPRRQISKAWRDQGWYQLSQQLRRMALLVIDAVLLHGEASGSDV